MNIRALERDLASVGSLAQIMALMKREFGAIGSLENWTYIFQIVETFHTPPCICMTTIAQDFLAHYMSNSYYLADPLAKHFTSSNLPLFWKIEDDWSGYGPEALEFQRWLKDLGYWGGVCIPVFSKEGTRGFLSFNSRSHDTAVIDQAARASFLIRYFHHHIMRIWVATHPGHTSLRARLTPREGNILLAVADGLTAAEIGIKLKLSRRTVESHLAAVQEKLQAENRQQALCKAVNLGLLQPDKGYEEQVLFVF